MAAQTIIGADYRMRDAVERVVGTVPFVLDRDVAGMAHGKAVRSSVPHGRIRRVDTAQARQAPGVVAVVTGADLQAAEGLDPYFGAMRADQPALAIDKVRYAGEPVAVVVAETAREAEAASRLVQVDYDEIDHVVDPVEAMQPDAPLVHDRWPGNQCGDWALRHGDLDRGWHEAQRVYEATYLTPPGSHVPMEPFVCVAQWQDGAGLMLWSSTQAPHAVRDALAKMFNLRPAAVRVATVNLGGAYGAKGQVKIEPMVACAARFAGRPVRMELARDEVFLTVGRHAAQVRIRTGVTLDGTITAREVDVVYNAGAYAITSPGAAGQGLVRALGPYRIPNITVTSTARYTNTVPTCPFRGAMTSQVCLAYEGQLDEIAADLGIDPLEMRRGNLLRDGDEFGTGEVMHDLHYDELLDAVAQAVDWGAPSGPAPAGKARGKGLAIMIKSTLTPSRSEARVELGDDGAVRLFSSSVEMGQGSNATLIQILAEALGVDPGRIEMPFPDTAVTPFDTITASSRTTSSMGAAIRDAAENLKQELARLAAKEWDVAPEQITVDGDVVRTEGAEDEGMSSAQLLAASGLGEVSAEGIFQSAGGMSGVDPQNVQGQVTVHWHQGAVSAEVEVDLETGRVEVLRCHGATYAGRVINPFRVRQQNEGGIIFGLGPAMFEEVQYSAGQMTNPNLSDYMIPSILDIPRSLSSTAVESSDAAAEIHGVGEMTLPAVAPAVANAIADAAGIHLRRVPLTPERVLRALHDREATDQGEPS